MKGYFGNPEATADCIRDGWFHTGDLGYYDQEGNFYIADRLKELIKVKGLQVPPAELEDVLRTLPGVEDVAVVGVPHERFGEAPRAYIIKSKGSDLNEEQVRVHVDYMTQLCDICHMIV